MLSRTVWHPTFHHPNILSLWGTVCIDTVLSGCSRHLRSNLHFSYDYPRYDRQQRVFPGYTIVLVKTSACILCHIDSITFCCFWLLQSCRKLMQQLTNTNLDNHKCSLCPDIIVSLYVVCKLQPDSQQVYKPIFAGRFLQFYCIDKLSTVCLRFSGTLWKSNPLTHFVFSYTTTNRKSVSIFRGCFWLIGC